MKGYPLDIDAKRHLKKFLWRKLGLKNKQRFYVNTETHWGNYLVLLLKASGREFQHTYAKEKFPVRYELEISEKAYERGIYYLSKGNAVKFNSYIEKLFNQELYDYIEARVNNYDQFLENWERQDKKFNISERVGLDIKSRLFRHMKRENIKDSIYAFMNKYCIEEDDIAHHALVKRHQRYRKNKNEFPENYANETA